MWLQKSAREYTVMDCDAPGTIVGNVPKATDADSDYQQNNVITYSGIGAVGISFTTLHVRAVAPPESKRLQQPLGNDTRSVDVCRGSVFTSWQESEEEEDDDNDDDVDDDDGDDDDDNDDNDGGCHVVGGDGCNTLTVTR